MNDLSGRQVGRLQVLQLDTCRSRKPPRKLLYWWCLCLCGRICSVLSVSLSGTKYQQKSCGCLVKESAAKARAFIRQEQHGESKNKTKEYSCWTSMLQRCFNPNNIGYKNYGGRGITVCERWRNSFRSFLEDMGRKPCKNLTLDRIDVNGNYEPYNCRWASRKIQTRNRRVTVLDEDSVRQIRELRQSGLSLAQIARHLGVKRGVVESVIYNKSWSDIQLKDKENANEAEPECVAN